jgi:hypothetical protein
MQATSGSRLTNGYPHERTVAGRSRCPQNSR